MGESVLFPDAADVAITVAGGGTDAPVSGDVPDPRPSRFATIVRKGGPRRPGALVIDDALLVVSSWGATPVEAHDLAQEIRRALHGASGEVVGGVTVYRVEEYSGPMDDPDPDSDQPRVSQRFLFPTRGT